MELLNVINRTITEGTTIAGGGGGTAFTADKTDRISAQVNITLGAPTAKAVASGTAEVQTLTFLDQASTGNLDYVVIAAADGTTYAVAMRKTGVASPTGAKWTAIPAANKAIADISAATTAAEVAAAAELALDAITGLTGKIITDDSAADGTMLLTGVESGPAANPDPENADDSGAGTIAGVETTPGVLGDISVANDTFIEVAHGYATGLKGQVSTSTTLPGGVVAVTDYWIIKIDADTFKLASSLENALAGTPLVITSIGVGNQTFTPTALAGGSVKMQQSIDGGVTWFDMTSPAAQNVTAAGSFLFPIPNRTSHEYRPYLVTTAGQLVLVDVDVFGIGPT